MIQTDSQDFLQTALAEIKLHLGEADFNVDRLSRKLGVSRMQLHRRLRELGQPAAGELLRNMRLEHAAVLLCQRRLTIAEVANRSGFRSPAYFAHCFRDRFGCTPRQFAQQNQSLKRGNAAKESKGFSISGLN